MRLVFHMGSCWGPINVETECQYRIPFNKTISDTVSLLIESKFRFHYLVYGVRATTLKRVLRSFSPIYLKEAIIMNRNDSVPLPSNTREWLLNRNSMIILADVLLFALLYFTLPFEPSVALGIISWCLLLCCG